VNEISKNIVKVLVENYDIVKFEPKPFTIVSETLSIDKVNEIITRMPVKTEKPKLNILDYIQKR
jgi:hypothetical protein